MSSEVVFWIVVGISSVTLIASAHSVLWSATAGWHYANIRALRAQGLNAYRRRQDNPPWYVRYTAWLDEKLGRKKGDS